MNLPSQWNKPPRAQQSCSNCNAFFANKQANPRSGEPRQGWCLAAPPVAMPGMAQASPLAAAGQPQMVMQGIWPPTMADRWCRAWETDDDGPNTAGTA